jgi:hypothetical protein
MPCFRVKNRILVIAAKPISREYDDGINDVGERIVGAE